MKSYTVSKNPVFSASVPVIEESDPVNAEVTNTPTKKLIENDLALKAMLEKKMDPEEGMWLSHNDFTDEYKEAVDGLNGLKFGQDAKGNWGYLAPDTEEMVPFGGREGDGYASKDIYGDDAVSLGRLADSETGHKSFAFGNYVAATGSYSHAEGNNTRAEGIGAYAYGIRCLASGNYSHAEGGSYRTDETTLASGEFSHAEGQQTTASGGGSHAEGLASTASAPRSHAEGGWATASGTDSHAEGCLTLAKSNCAHAEGHQTTASGDCSHAEGFKTLAEGISSHAGGENTCAANYASTACGHYNAIMTTGGMANNTTGHAFVIGNGVSDTQLRNALSIMYDGTVKAASTVTGSTTADYAEFFEWDDGNPGFEDRVGYFVTMDEDKIKIAGSGDSYILGIVSGEPFVLGNGDCDAWNGMVLRDEFGRVIYERAPLIERVEFQLGNGAKTVELRPVLDADGEQLYMGTRPKINPDYNPDEPYVSRSDRPEWSPVGMLGVLSVRQDGTCRVNGYCTCSEGGIATACEEGDKNSYRVIKVISGQVVKVVFR